MSALSSQFPAEFAGKGIDELVARRDAISEWLDSGSQTRVAIAPGMAHEFAGKSHADLARRLDKICFALHLLGSAADLSPNPYPNPYAARPNQTTPSFR